MRTTRLELCADPRELLHVAGDWLGDDPVTSTVVTTAAYRAVRALAEGAAPPERDWWLVVREESGRVCGAGMRTAPYPPYPPYLLPMPPAAAVAVARRLHDRGEQLRGVNGALPGVELCAVEAARLGGGRVEVAQQTRLHELGELVAPAPVPGALRLAGAPDLDLVLEWVTAFMGDADEQAGRRRGDTAHEVPDRAELLRRVRAGTIWLWVDGAGRPVNLVGANPPAFGVARVGPVYTPPAERGRGWASTAVAEVSRRLRADGARVCLFTDQANPVSNKVYVALGFHPVVDMANLVIHG